MLSYEPGASPWHRLDPRSKLAVQIGFAAVAFAYTTPRGLTVLTALALGLLATAYLSPVYVLYRFRYFLPFLVVAPVLEAATLGSPWFVPADAVDTVLASYRVLLILLVSAAYVHTTPARESRAAIQRTVPGKPGQFLGMGVGLVFRFLPVLRDDLLRAREAMHARLGDQRPLTERMELLTVIGIQRTFDRADRLSTALQARCLAWNPTLPALSLSRADWIVLCGSFLLFGLGVGRLAGLVPAVPAPTSVVIVQ